jgi:ketosteroid isomerase-like protein
MSEENEALVRTIVPEPDTEMGELFRGEDSFAQMREAVGPLVTEDFESVMVFPGQARRTYPGLEGFRQNWLDWLEPWATYRAEIDEVIDLGERVLVLIRNYGRRLDIDAEVELRGASICTIREGKIARWEDYAIRDEALEAAGLSD